MLVPTPARAWFAMQAAELARPDWPDLNCARFELVQETVCVDVYLIELESVAKSFVPWLPTHSEFPGPYPWLIRVARPKTSTIERIQGFRFGSKRIDADPGCLPAAMDASEVGGGSAGERSRIAIRATLPGGNSDGKLPGSTGY